MNINANSCNVQTAERTMGMPEEGPKLIPLVLDFTQNDTYTLDLSNLMQRGFISMIQTIYADNTDNGGELVILVNTSQQRIIVPAGAEAYLPILVPNPARMSFTSPGAPSITVQLLNFPIAPEVWSAAAMVRTLSWTATSTNPDTLVADSVFDMAPMVAGNWTYLNQGPGDVTFTLKGANLADLSDEVTIATGNIPAGSFVTESFGLGQIIRYERVFIHSTVADTPGTIVAGGYFSGLG